jgi:ubiquinone/menaquinone biosynthesis C-methylase UbiE
MSRKGIGVDNEKRWVFNRLAGAYRSRPGYPATLVDRLAALSGGAGTSAADLGAGTGLLAIPLTERGLRVAAVEPARAMLDELAGAAGLPRAVASLGAAPDMATPLRLVHATAEQTTLPSAQFHLVVLADALQWVDPELTGLEAARLLRPGGVAAVVEARLAETPFLLELGALLAAYNPKSRARRPGEVRQVLSLATGGASPLEETFDHEAVLNDAALEGVLRSLSFVGPARGTSALDALLLDARRLAAVHGGAVWRRKLTLTFARHRL